MKKRIEEELYERAGDPDYIHELTGEPLDDSCLIERNNPEDEKQKEEQDEVIKEMSADER